MKKKDALQLAKLLRERCRKRSANLQLEELDEGAKAWRHRWIVGKESIAGFSAVPRDGEPELCLTFTEFSPKRYPGRWFLLVVDPRKLDSTIAEIHHVDGAGSLWWRYVAKKRDGKNELRRKRFARRYPGNVVTIELPSHPNGAGRFVREVLTLARTRVLADALGDVEPGNPVDEEASAFEGEKQQKFITHRKRERSLRDKKLASFRKRHGGKLFCQVPRCGFSFPETFGVDEASTCVEVHHLRPLRFADEPVKTHLSELAIVCPNCHRMIHHGGQNRSLAKLIVRA